MMQQMMQSVCMPHIKVFYNVLFLLHSEKLIGEKNLTLCASVCELLVISAILCWISIDLCCYCGFTGGLNRLSP